MPALAMGYEGGVLDYEGRIKDEVKMWQPAVDAERREIHAKQQLEREKKERWAAAFPVCTEMAPPQGVERADDPSIRRVQHRRYAEEDLDWMRNFYYSLSPVRIVAEVLSFISTCQDSLPDRRLFYTDGQEIRINKRYVPSNSEAEKRLWTDCMVKSIGQFYLHTRIQLDNIIDFVNSTRTRLDKGKEWIPQSVRELANFCAQFLADHHASVQSMEREERTDPAQLAVATGEMRSCVDLVHHIVDPYRLEDKWNHERVDSLWAHVIGFTIEPLVTPEHQTELLRRLQDALLPVFLSYADSLYSFGTVPAHLESEFAFYMNRSESLILPSRTSHPRYAECRVAIRPSLCRLWSSDAFLRTTLVGIQTRTRLGPLSSLSPSFSAHFYAALATADNEGRNPYSLVDMQSSFLIAARTCTRQLSEEFMGLFKKEHRLGNLMQDVKSIFIGAALCSYADFLRGGAVSRPNEVREAFAHSLEKGGIPQRRSRLWTVATDVKYGRVEAKIAWPLEYVIRPQLIILLEETRHFFLALLRCRQILIDIQLGCVDAVPGSCIRQFMAVLSQLIHMVISITELFHMQAVYLVDHHFEVIDRCETVDEAIEQSNELHDKLRDLVSSEGIRRIVRDTVEHMSRISDEMQLDLLSGTITDTRVGSWALAVRRYHDNLIDLGSKMTGNVIADLSSVLAVNPSNPASKKR